jgi:hypothetical protein
MRARTDLLADLGGHAYRFTRLNKDGGFELRHSGNN